MQAPNWTDFLHCSVCTVKYNTTTAVPVSLNCSHSMCKRCLSRLQTKQCPYDKLPIPSNLDKYPPNTAFLVLLGYQPESWSHEMAYFFPTIVQETELEEFSACREALEGLAQFLKPFTDQGFLHATANIPRPILKKLTGLLSNQILDGEGRMKAVNAAQSIAERIITELLIMHQNQHQISSALWSAVRCRGCQFLGPVMQEEALKLILKALENRRSLSRKTIVMYVVQQLQPDFQNASKTNIGHVVQLLYRASCFNVEKRPNDSSLMQLKEEYCTYEALRREHDSQIIKIAMEAGLRISPETWSSQLYGTTNKKSEMQSIIDKLVSLGVGSSGISELIVAIGRSQDQYNLNERLVSHLDALLQIENPIGERDESDSIPVPACSWELCSKALSELLTCLQVFTDFTQVKSGRYKTGMCPYLVKPGGCPRGALCPYAHTEDERKKYVNMAKPKSRLKPRPDIPPTTPPQLRAPNMRGDGGASSLPVRQYSADMSDGSFSSFESASFPGNSSALYSSHHPPSLAHSDVQQRSEASYFVRPGPSSINHAGFFQDDVTQGVAASGGGAYHSSHPPPMTQQKGYHSFDGGDINNSGMYTRPHPPGPYQQLTPGKSNPDQQGRHYAHSISLTTPTTSNHSARSEFNPNSNSESSRSSQASYYSQDGEMGGTSTWKYNRPDSSLSRSPSGTSSLSDEGGTSERGVHTPVARDDGSEDEGKLSSNVPNKTMVSRGGMAPGKTTPTNSKSSSENKMVEELTAKVKELEMKLEEKEIKRNREQVLPLPPPPPPPAAATVPIHHYYTRPQSAGVISGGHVVGGVMGRPIHFSGQQHFMQATPFYDPFNGGLPNQVWCPPIAVSPQTTPPNSGLLVHHPHPPAPAPPPPHIGHHPQPPPPHHHHHLQPTMDFQVQSDEYLAHYLTFQEQAKARPHQIAPGAHLPPLHPPPPAMHQAPPPLPPHMYPFDYNPMMTAHLL